MPVTYKRAKGLNMTLIKAMTRVQEACSDKDGQEYLQSRVELLAPVLSQATFLEASIGRFKTEETEA